MPSYFIKLPGDTIPSGAAFTEEAARLFGASSKMLEALEGMLESYELLVSQAEKIGNPHLTQFVRASFTGEPERTRAAISQARGDANEQAEGQKNG